MIQAPALTRRVEITQATLDRYVGRELNYGAVDCVQIAAFHLRAMGLKVLLSKGGRYRTELGAAKALKRAGFASLAEALEDLGLDRVPAASVIVGDLLEIPTAASIGCLMIALGNGRALGFVDDHPVAAVLQPLQYVAGWRAPLNP